MALSAVSLVPVRIGSAVMNLRRLRRYRNDIYVCVARGSHTVSHENRVIDVHTLELLIRLLEGESGFLRSPSGNCTYESMTRMLGRK